MEPLHPIGPPASGDFFAAFHPFGDIGGRFAFAMFPIFRLGVARRVQDRLHMPCLAQDEFDIFAAEQLRGAIACPPWRDVVGCPAQNEQVARHLGQVKHVP